MGHLRFVGRRACLTVIAAAVGFSLVASAQAETPLARAYRVIAGKRATLRRKDTAGLPALEATLWARNGR